jgi:branched-chain amino acid transport system substrate-binding protein
MQPSGKMGRRDFLRGLGASGVVLGSTGLLAACGELAGGGAREASSLLRIAYITPQTGPLAGLVAQDDYVLSRVRDALADGVTNGSSTYEIEIITKDTQSDASRAAEVAREAILDDEVDLIITGGTPDTNNPVSDQAEAQGVPCMNTLCPWESWFYDRGGEESDGFQYTYMFFVGGSGEALLVPPFMAGLDSNGVLGALWPNNVDGNIFRELLAPPFEEAGLELVDPGAYAEPAQDYGTQITQFRQANAELLTGCPATPDFATFWRQAQQMDYLPRYAYIHKAILFPDAVESLGDLGENLLTTAWWTPDLPYESALDGSSAQEFADGYTEETGNQWTMPMAFMYAAFEASIRAIEEAEDPTDPDSLADAMGQLQMDTMVGPLDFTSGPAPNVSENPPYVSQWQRGEGDFMYELRIVDSPLAPEVPVTGEVRPLPWAE